ncbi:MAG: TIGR03546 family protein [Calditrichaeota bacterium]|nr:MAG: TIGR03546 family protein [Calditrichota bacterium]
MFVYSPHVTSPVHKEASVLWFKFLSKFIKVLRAGESPSLIAGGLTLGFVVGLTPFWTLQNVLLLLAAILTTVNLAAVFFSIFVFSFVAYLFDPLFHALGYVLLAQVEALRGLWTTLYNSPIAPFTRFNNTVVMGSLLTALLLAVPFYLGSKKAIVAYRQKWGAKLENSKVVKAIKGSTVVKWYLKIRDLEF